MTKLILVEQMDTNNVEIFRSSKRKKTIQARAINNKLRIYLPSGLTKKEEEKWIKTMIEKSNKRKIRNKLNSSKDLQKRANELNKKFFENSLEFHIKYVTNQNSKFGSCTPKTKMIRISDKLAEMPRWVQDYVIIHELAHLLFPNHSKEFWDKVNQYNYVERAKGYLIAIGLMSDITEF